MGIMARVAMQTRLTTLGQRDRKWISIR